MTSVQLSVTGTAVAATMAAAISFAGPMARNDPTRGESRVSLKLVVSNLVGSQCTQGAVQNNMCTRCWNPRIRSVAP